MASRKELTLFDIFQGFNCNFIKENKMNMRVILAATTISLSVLAFAAQAAEPLAFQGVMKDLGNHTQTIAGAIAYEDWELVERTAPLIAAHPQPPAAEKERIFSFIAAIWGRSRRSTCKPMRPRTKWNMRRMQRTG